MGFHSILFADREGDEPAGYAPQPDCFADLNLDQVIEHVTHGREDYDLKAFFHTPLRDAELVAYRQAVMHDLEDPETFAAIRRFSQTMRSRRRQRRHAAALAHPLEAQRWQLDAAGSYRQAVSELHRDLAARPLQSEGLRAFFGFLADYIASTPFTRECEAIDAVEAELAGVHYAVLLREEGIEVRRYDGEPDYAAEVADAFAVLREEPLRPVMEASSPETTSLNPIEAKILEFTAKLFPEPFDHLAAVCEEYADYADPTVLRFEREVQFYMAYLEYAARLRREGLAFCYPTLQSQKAGVGADDAFDIALADSLGSRAGEIVSNGFHLEEPERVLVVSGPNQGGKTTFARTVGQLHYLASLGAPVPGTRATLLLADGIFTHFDREEAIADLRGKLEDDLHRVRGILDQATAHSVVILNEIFHSTQVNDAVSLTRWVLEDVIARDALGVCVTFIEEVSRLNEATVSLVSEADPAAPEARTYRLVRRPADGRAYALSIAQKHDLTYRDLARRLGL